MDAATWKRLVKPLMDDDWRLRGSFAYVRPVAWTLHGVLKEASSTGGFYLWVVKMPLILPSDHIDLSWSDRFGGGSAIFFPTDSSTPNRIDSAMRIARSEALNQVGPIPELDLGRNVHLQEVRSYGYFLEGRPRAAVKGLDRVLRYPAKRTWELEEANRAHEMRELIKQGNDAEAMHRLESWRLHTIAALGIDPS